MELLAEGLDADEHGLTSVGPRDPAVLEPTTARKYLTSLPTALIALALELLERRTPEGGDSTLSIALGHELTVSMLPSEKREELRCRTGCLNGRFDLLGEVLGGLAKVLALQAAVVVENRSCSAQSRFLQDKTPLEGSRASQGGSL